MMIESPRRSLLRRKISRLRGQAKEVMGLAIGTRTIAGRTHKGMLRHETQVKDKPWVRRSLPLKGDLDKRDTRKYYVFCGKHGHTTNNCFAWKAHLEELVREGHCTEFIAKQVIQQIEDRDTAKETPQKVIRINTILVD
ncbi:unnamed protein product [Prunus armeniaca]